MEMDRFYHAYVDHTVLHPLGLAAVVVLGLAMLLLPRRYAPIPVLLMACFVAPAQRIDVFTLNFDLLRVMVIVGTARVLVRREWRHLTWKSLDSILVANGVFGFFAVSILFMNSIAIKYEAGRLYDMIGLYFLFRCLVRDYDDVRSLSKAAALIAIPVATAFLIEHVTGRNVFSTLGGVPEVTVVRDGRLRCQGAFAHPIVAGCFWASFIPLMATLWGNGRGVSRSYASLGIGCALVVIWACSSSTPVVDVAIALLCCLLYPLRRYMRHIRWGVLFILCLLQIVMSGPIWKLLARGDVISGSDSYFRYALLDNFINHSHEWWLLGSTIGTAHWGDGMTDVTDLYVCEGLQGGIVLLALFVAMIFVGFKEVGKLMRASEPNEQHRRVSWALGTMLFMQSMNFFSVTLFGQMNVIWYLQLALISSLAPVPVTAQNDHGASYRPGARRAVRRNGRRAYAVRQVCSVPSVAGHEQLV